MPPRLTRVSAEVTIRVLKHLGFVQTRQSGSHVVLRKEAEGRIVGCVVPLHKGDMPIGTLRSVLRQAVVTPEEFMNNL